MEGHTSHSPSRRGYDISRTPTHVRLGNPTLGAAPLRSVRSNRNLDRHNAGWESVRDGVDNEGGWPLYLQRYAALFERNA
jgi:hypothetical protein